MKLSLHSQLASQLVELDIRDTRLRISDVEHAAAAVARTRLALDAGPVRIPPRRNATAVRSRTSLPN